MQFERRTRLSCGNSADKGTTMAKKTNPALDAWFKEHVVIAGDVSKDFANKLTEKLKVEVAKSNERIAKTAARVAKQKERGK